MLEGKRQPMRLQVGSVVREPNCFASSLSLSWSQQQETRLLRWVSQNYWRAVWIGQAQAEDGPVWPESWVRGGEKGRFGGGTGPATVIFKSSHLSVLTYPLFSPK